MEDRTITLIDDDGKEVVCDILFTYHNDKNNKNYVVFVDRKTKNVSAVEYIEHGNGEGEIKPVETDEEWAMLEKLLDDYQNQMEDDEEDGEDLS